MMERIFKGKKMENMHKTRKNEAGSQHAGTRTLFPQIFVSI